MATGDLRGNLRRLQQEMRFLHYPHCVDHEGLVRGAPEAVLPLLHHALEDVSPLLAAELVQFDIQLTSKSDFRFVTAVYKALRDVLGIRPVLTREQLLQPGFAERKMQLVCAIGSAVRTRYRQQNKAKSSVRSNTVPTTLITFCLSFYYLQMMLKPLKRLQLKLKRDMISESTMAMTGGWYRGLEDVIQRSITKSLLVDVCYLIIQIFQRIAKKIARCTYWSGPQTVTYYSGCFHQTER
uniref:Centrosomal protein of 44 kDa n=1 Tax=Eptatretus burgeri TaxID=7764 RepID=A0A8C4QU02_EPTBU